MRTVYSHKNNLVILFVWTIQPDIFCYFHGIGNVVFVSCIEQSGFHAVWQNVLEN